MQGTQCQRNAQGGRDVCHIHSPEHDTFGPAKKASDAARDIWYRLRKAEKRYPLKDWGSTISWLNGEIVLCREAIEDVAKGKGTPAEQAKVVLGGTNVLQKWARLLTEPLKNSDEQTQGQGQVVFNLEARPPEKVH